MRKSRKCGLRAAKKPVGDFCGVGDAVERNFFGERRRRRRQRRRLRERKNWSRSETKSEEKKTKRSHSELHGKSLGKRK